MRGLIYLGICKLNKPVLTQYVIHLEKQLFGQIPSVFLQNILLDKSEPLSLSWLEKTLTFIHGTHYIAFLFVGFIIWIYKKQSFREYKLAFYLLVSSGISLYFLIPTTPPWIAYELFEAVPELIHFNTEIYNMHIPDLTSKFGTNPVAAMPSLHTAFPLLCAFLLFKYFRWKSWPFLVYTTAVLFTIVYTGDHYFIDIIAGAILALLSFFLPSIIKKNLKKKPKIGSNSIPANLKLNKRRGLIKSIITVMRIIFKIALFTTPPLILTAIRLGFLLLFMSPLFVVKQDVIRSFSKRQILIVTIAGIIGITLGGLAFYISLDILGAARTTPITAVSPMFAALFAWAILKERIRVSQAFGILLTIAGIWIVTLL